MVQLPVVIVNMGSRLPQLSSNANEPITENKFENRMCTFLDMVPLPVDPEVKVSMGSLLFNAYAQGVYNWV